MRLKDKMQRFRKNPCDKGFGQYFEQHDVNKNRYSSFTQILDPYKLCLVSQDPDKWSNWS